MLWCLGSVWRVLGLCGHNKLEVLAFNYLFKMCPKMIMENERFSREWTQSLKKTTDLGSIPKAKMGKGINSGQEVWIQEQRVTSLSTSTPLTMKMTGFQGTTSERLLAENSASQKANSSSKDHRPMIPSSRSPKESF